MPPNGSGCMLSYLANVVPLRRLTKWPSFPPKMRTILKIGVSTWDGVVRRCVTLRLSLCHCCTFGTRVGLCMRGKHGDFVFSLLRDVNAMHFEV